MAKFNGESRVNIKPQRLPRADKLAIVNLILNAVIIGILVWKLL